MLIRIQREGRTGRKAQTRAQKRPHSSPKPRYRELQAALPNAGRIPSQVGLLRPEVYAGLAVDDALGGAAAAAADHRLAAGVGFDGHDPKVLDPGKNDRSATAVEVTQFLVGHPAQEPHIARRCGEQLAFLRSRAGNQE